MINNIVTKIFNFYICAYYLSPNRGTLVVYIAQTVYVLHHSKYKAICSIDVAISTSLPFFEIDNFFLLIVRKIRIFFSFYLRKIRICYFIPVSA